MLRFDLLDEWACIVVPRNLRHQTKADGEDQESDLDGRRREQRAPPPQRRGQLFYDAVMANGVCPCWISW
jgi:hypothetical protein